MKPFLLALAALAPLLARSQTATFDGTDYDRFIKDPAKRQAMREKHLAALKGLRSVVVAHESWDDDVSAGIARALSGAGLAVIDGASALFGAQTDGAGLPPSMKETPMLEFLVRRGSAKGANGPGHLLIVRMTEAGTVGRTGQATDSAESLRLYFAFDGDGDERAEILYAARKIAALYREANPKQ